MAVKTKERKLTITIQAKDAFSSVFNKAGSLAKTTGSVITKSFKTATIAVAGTAAAFTAAQGAIVLFASSIAASDDKLGKMASRIGATTEALSEYQHVAELSGITTQTLATAWQRQGRRISEAAKGMGTAKTALEELNLTAQQLKDLKPEEQFELIAESMLNVTNQGDKMRIAMKIWDTEGVSLLQTMEGGAAGIREMREEARLLGLSMSQTEAKAAADYNDAMTRLSATFTGLKRQIAQEILPTLTQSFIDIKNNIIEFLPTIKKVISTAITVIMNLPETLVLVAATVRKIYKRMTLDTAKQAGSIVELMTTAFVTLGPAIGAVMVEIAQVVFSPLSAAFVAVLSNMKNKMVNFWKELQIDSLNQDILLDPIISASPELIAATQNKINELLAEINDGYTDVAAAAKNSLEDAFNKVDFDFAKLKTGFSLLGTALSTVWEEAKNDPALQDLIKEINKLRDIRDSPITDTQKNKSSAASAIFSSSTAGTKRKQTLAEGPTSTDAFLAEEQQRLLEQDQFKRTMALSFFDFQSDLAVQTVQIQKTAAEQQITIDDELAQTYAINAMKRAEAQAAASAINTAANKAMEDQLLSLVETGQFSVDEFAKIVVQQVKTELIGIAARASVNALFQTGMGFAAAATGNTASASLHFTAAGQFAAIAGAALLGAAAVNAALGGTDTDTDTDTDDDTDDDTPGSDSDIPSLPDTSSSGGTTINFEINNPLGSEDWDKIVREEIVPAINRGGADNITIDSTAILEV